MLFCFLPPAYSLGVIFDVHFLWSHLFPRRHSCLNLFDTSIPHQMASPVPSPGFCKSLSWVGGMSWKHDDGGGDTFFLFMAVPVSVFLLPWNLGSHPMPSFLPSPKWTQIWNRALFKNNSPSEEESSVSKHVVAQHALLQVGGKERISLGHIALLLSLLGGLFMLLRLLHLGGTSH